MKSRALLFISALCLIAPLAALADSTGAPYVPGTSGLTLPSLSLSFANGQKPADMVSVLRIVMMLTVLSLAPAILIMTTSFTRIVVVLSFLRQALGTQQMRRTTIQAPTLAIVFWMTLASTLVMTVATVLFERDRWMAPPPATWGAIAYNAILIFGFAQAIWMIMARNLPPIASSMSVMMIPVLGVVSGAWWLNEQLHWQDGAAIVLVMVAIASVMWPARRGAAAAAQPVEPA